MKRICIINNDIMSADLALDYKSYSSMISNLLCAQGFSGEVEAFNSKDGSSYPEKFDAFDAVLLSGSHCDAFGNDDWIKELRRRIENGLSDGARFAGICFGHQILALNLGAEVDRSEFGWNLGCQTYQVYPSGLKSFQRHETITLYAAHQDRVIGLPSGAQLLAANANCPIAAYLWKNQVFCLQAHPEFDQYFMKIILERLKGRLNPEQHLRFSESLSQRAEGSLVARAMVEWINMPSLDTAALR